MIATRLFRAAAVTLLIAVVTACTAGPSPRTDATSSAPRIDATSDAAFERSMRRMKASLAPARQTQLDIAILKLNLVGVTSARQTIDDPALQNLSASRIKDRIAGKSADEIIALADATSTVKVFRPGEEPGLSPDARRALESGTATFPLGGSRWRYTSMINGNAATSVFDFRADGSLIDEVNRANATGPSSWEQSGGEVRGLLNGRGAFFIGRWIDHDTMGGTGGNAYGATWTWTAKRVP